VRILHVLDYSPTFPGGVVDHLAALGGALRDRGDDLVVAFPRERPWMRGLGVDVRTLVVPEIRRPLRRGFARRLERIRREWRIDLAHLSFSFALPLAVACGRRRGGMPIVFHWHNPPRALMRPPHSGGGHGRPLPKLAAGIAARFADRRAIDAHVVVSGEIRELLLSRAWTCSAKILHLPNALPRVPYADDSWDGTAPHGRAFVVGSVAGFRPQKDHETLLRAFASLLGEQPSSRLILAGDGPTRGAAENLAAALGIGHAVRFLGSVDDPATAYREMDASVLSTRYEGHPIALLEAMGHALPVVASDLPVIRETVRDGVDGLLVPPGDARAMASALLRLARDPGLRRSLGRAGRGRALSEFALSHWTARLLDLYDGLLAGGGGA
jgi:glycosyltransferase involved in cell wall biosynthesis